MVDDDEKRELRVSSVTFERGERHFLYTTCFYPTYDTWICLFCLVCVEKRTSHHDQQELSCSFPLSSSISLRSESCLLQ